MHSGGGGLVEVIMSATPEAALHPRSEEQHVLLEGISWERFEQLSACFDDSRAVRLTYIDGSVEIMSPIGEGHEALKSSIGRLLETFLDLKGVRYYRRGGFTLRQPGRAAGEPDESYGIGSNKAVPDLVIEVVVTTDALSKLPLYRAKGVPEVWIWKDGALTIHALEQGDYVMSRDSRLFTDLDIGMFARFVTMPDQYDAVRAFRKALQSP